jgi:hypothetical protein
MLRVNDQELESMKEFKYLESTLTEDNNMSIEKKYKF